MRIRVLAQQRSPLGREMPGSSACERRLNCARCRLLCKRGLRLDQLVELPETAGAMRRLCAVVVESCFLQLPFERTACVTRINVDGIPSLGQGAQNGSGLQGATVGPPGWGLARDQRRGSFRSSRAGLHSQRWDNSEGRTDCGTKRVERGVDFQLRRQDVTREFQSDVTLTERSVAPRSRLNIGASGTGRRNSLSVRARGRPARSPPPTVYRPRS